MKDFRKLRVWQESHDLTLRLYSLTQSFPKEELYGLTSQIRRAAVSIGANIAEGSARSGDREFSRFLQIALGSATELEYHLLLTYDLVFISEYTYKSLEEPLIGIKKMLVKFVAKLKAND